MSDTPNQREVDDPQSGKHEKGAESASPRDTNSPSSKVPPDSPATPEAGTDQVRLRELHQEELRPRGPLPSWVWIIVAVIALAPIFIALRKSRPHAELPTLGQVPNFDVVDDRSQPLSSSSLTGKVWVVNFFFTSCPIVCPKLMGRMAEVQAKVEKDGNGSKVRLLSLSVDPENDTPEKLRAYAERFGAKEGLWSLAVGKIEELDRIIVKGFKQHVQPADKNAGITQIMHGEWFVLVDQKGAIRGFYRTDDSVRFQDLLSDLAHLTGS